MTNPSSNELAGQLDEVTWARALARTLIRDPHLAEDVAQEALMISLAGHSAAVPRRSWIAGILRNLALKLSRTEARRDLREQAVARPEGTPAADQLVGRAGPPAGDRCRHGAG